MLQLAKSRPASEAGADKAAPFMASGSDAAEPGQVRHLRTASTVIPSRTRAAAAKIAVSPA
jgi:hypothetical protein